MSYEPHRPLYQRISASTSKAYNRRQNAESINEQLEVSIVEKHVHVWEMDYELESTFPGHVDEMWRLKCECGETMYTDEAIHLLNEMEKR